MISRTASISASRLAKVRGSTGQWKMTLISPGVTFTSLWPDLMRADDGDRHHRYSGIHRQMEWPLLEWQQPAVARARALGIDHHAQSRLQDFGCTANAVHRRIAIAPVHFDELGTPHGIPKNR